MSIRVEIAAKTDVGRARTNNEDAIFVCAEKGMAVLADGMGGYAAGEVASRIAVETLRQYVERELDVPDVEFRTHKAFGQLLEQAIQQANRTILDAVRDAPECAGMGTTIVAMLVRNGQVALGHVGDSRAYRLRGMDLCQLTRDHSFVQEQIDGGRMSSEEARLSPHRNLLTRALGAGPHLHVDISVQRAEPGDIYLLCSDGLSDPLSDTEIAEALNGETESLERTCDSLIDLANERAGLDNISVVLARVTTLPPERSLAGMLKKLLRQSQ